MFVCVCVADSKCGGVVVVVAAVYVKEGEEGGGLMLMLFPYGFPVIFKFLTAWYVAA